MRERLHAHNIALNELESAHFRCSVFFPSLLELHINRVALCSCQVVALNYR